MSVESMVDVPSASKARTGQSELLFVAIAIGLGCLIAAIPLAFNENPYFRDDIQSEYLPIFAAIGRDLLKGSWPFFTLQMQNGGALLAEYQYGLLNPVSLLADVWVALSPNPAIATTGLSGFYLTLLCCGTYLFARRVGATRTFALATATAFAGSNFVFYWYATSWLPGLISLAWFVWALNFLWGASTKRSTWVWAAVFCYLTLTAGWPHTDVMLGIAALAIAAAQVIRGDRRGAVTTLSCMAVAGLIAMPALIPVLGMGSVSARDASPLDTGNMVPNLYHLLGISSPFQFGQVRWGGNMQLATPIFFGAWYVVVLAPFVSWRKVDPRNGALPVLLSLTALTILATQGPDPLGPLKLPMRFLPFLHLFALASFAVAASQAGLVPTGRFRWSISIGLVIAGFLLSLQASALLWMLGLIGMLTVLAVLALWARAGDEPKWGRATTLVFGNLMLLTLTRVFLPTNANLPSWPVQSFAQETASLNEIPREYSFTLAPFGAIIRKGTAEPFGAMPLAAGNPTISGYTPIGHRGFAKKLCVETHGLVCARAADTLFQPSTLGPPLADLLSIERLRLFKNNDPQPVKKPQAGTWLTDTRVEVSPATRAALAKDWVLEEDGARFQTYRRRNPLPTHPGSVAWVSSGLTLSGARAPTATREEYQVVRRTGAEEEVVFNRINWPGYRATFADKPLAIGAREGFLVAVKLPAGVQSGALRLTYEPPLIRIGLAAALLGLVGLIAVTVLWKRLFGPAGRELA